MKKFEEPNLLVATLQANELIDSSALVPTEDVGGFLPGWGDAWE